MNNLRLIKQSRRGDRKAQRELYELYRNRWYLLALRYMGNREDAQDALQNALIKIYSNLASFNADQGSFCNWSRRVLVNECLMLIRKRGAAFSHGNKYAELQQTVTNETATSEMSAREILAMINVLPDGYRVVFNMYVMEGYSHQEIADCLDISVGTSKSQLYKARNMLQCQLKGLFEVVRP